MISQNETTVGVDGTFPPTVFSFAHGQLTGLTAVPWPLIEDELSLAHQLYALSTKWTISVLKNAAPALQSRLATDATAVAYEDLVAAEALKKQAAAAKAAVDTVLGINVKKVKKGKTKTTPAPGPEGGASGRGRGGRGAPRPDCHPNGKCNTVWHQRIVGITRTTHRFQK